MTFNLCLIQANQDQICASETESRTLHKKELGGTSKQPPFTATSYKQPSAPLQSLKRL